MKAADRFGVRAAFEGGQAQEGLADQLLAREKQGCELLECVAARDDGEAEDRVVEGFEIGREAAQVVDLFGEVDGGGQRALRGVVPWEGSRDRGQRVGACAAVVAGRPAGRAVVGFGGR
ncbi:hypothetical protein [Streptomyces sp. CNQ-509]|uniref:hypothetical protein n=1 Tax=Streptomyces sp. CNQ-509 TaxID=444103 RepID=UPI0013DD9C35|nr:hypothetical protein [Streptomyces sp. CNQ-509]